MPEYAGFLGIFFQVDRLTVGGLPMASISIGLNLRLGRAAILKYNHFPEFDDRERRKQRHSHHPAGYAGAGKAGTAANPLPTTLLRTLRESRLRWKSSAWN